MAELVIIPYLITTFGWWLLLIPLIVSEIIFLYTNPDESDWLPAKIMSIMAGIVITFALGVFFDFIYMIGWNVFWGIPVILFFGINYLVVKWRNK
jgi:hypothetical protein